MRSSSVICATLAAAALVAACSGDVQSDAGASSSSTTASGIDPDCFDACVKKGVSAADCEVFCSKTSSGKGASSGGKTSSSASSSSDMPTSGSGSGGIDPDIEKPCIECMYSQQAPACEQQATACEQDLACQQLQWCPTLCGKDGCFEECNEVIPDGVAPLSALVQCAVCDAGPCAQECVGSVLLGFCK